MEQTYSINFKVLVNFIECLLCLLESTGFVKKMHVQFGGSTFANSNLTGCEVGISDVNCQHFSSLSCQVLHI